MSTKKNAIPTCNTCDHSQGSHEDGSGACLRYSKINDTFGAQCDCDEFVLNPDEELDECIYECDLTFGDVIELRKWSLNKVVDFNLDSQTDGYGTIEKILDASEKVFRFLISDKEYNNE